MNRTGKDRARPRRKDTVEREQRVERILEEQERERLAQDYAGLGYVRFFQLAGRLADAADFPQSDAAPLFTGPETARKIALYREFQTILEELSLAERSPFQSRFDRIAAIDRWVKEGKVLRFQRHKGHSINREINRRYTTRYDNGDNDDRAS